MKKLILLVVLALCSTHIQAQTSLPTDSLKMVSWLKAGKDSVKVFYGLPAHKIINLPLEKAKKFIEKRKITVAQYFSAKLSAENYLIGLNIKKDSVEVMRIYDRIQKKLSIGNGNH